MEKPSFALGRLVSTRSLRVFLRLCGRIAPVVGVPLVACDSGGSTQAEFLAAITAEPTTGNAPVSVHFVAQHNGGLDAAVTFAWDFGDGEVGEGRETDHVFATAGDFTVTVTVTDPSLGTATADKILTIEPSVDFRVQDVNLGSQSARPGGEIQVSGGLVNAGAAPIGEWTLTYVLSTDAAFSDDDLRLTVIPREGQPVAPLESLDQTLTLPADLPSGTYYAGIYADLEGYIGDVDRADNVGWSAFPIDVRNATDSGPDLVICGLAIPAFEGLRAGERPQIQQGDQVEVTVCLANGGTAPTLDAAIELFLSRDVLVDDADLSLYARTGQTLGQGDRFEDTVDVDIPIDLETGSWYVLAVADRTDLIEEQSESNNLKSSAEPLDVVEPGEVEGVDLVVTDFSSSAEKSFWGQSFPVVLEIVNRGHTAVGRNFVVRVEAEPSDGRQAVTVLSLNVGGIAAGETKSLDTDVVVTRRIEPGQYCLRAVADPTGSAMDANPGNNRRRGTCLQLGGEPNIDFSVRSVSLEPENIEAGGMLRLEATVQNLGVDATGPAEAAVVFSVDAQYGPGDRVVGRIDLEPIAGGESVAIDQMVTVPVDLDRNVAAWHVALVVDPDERVADELTRENNVAFAPDTVTVTGSMGGCAEDEENEENDQANRAASLAAGLNPEFGLCDGADWFAIDVPAGNALVVAATVAEVSFATTGQVPALVIQTAAGDRVSTGDSLDSRTTALAEPVPVDRSLRIGLTSAVELVYALEVSLLPVGDTPNLRPRALSVAPGSLGAGGFVTVELEAVNIGGSATAACVAAVHLVAAGGPPTPETRIGELAVGPVDSAAVAPLSGVVSIPAEALAGDYELVVVLDGDETVDESDEGDNAQRAPVQITGDGACTPDDFEPNRSSLLADGGAAVAALLPVGRHTDLAVCTNDDDWYAVDLGPGEGLRALTEFDGGANDIDLYLYGPDGTTELDSSRSGVASTETVEFFGDVRGGRYFLRVYVRPGAAGPATSSTYVLDLQINAAGGCEPDVFDPNASAESAAVVADGDYVLALCPGVEDWFRFSLVAGNTVSFQARSDAEIHLTLFGPDDEPVDDGDLTVVWDAEVDGIYRLKVESAAPVPVSYSLRVRGASGIDLEATSLEVSPAAAAAGDELRVTARVRNALGDTVQDVTVRLLLSDDDLPSPNDTELQRVVLPRVGNVVGADLRARVRVPAGATAGAKFIVLEIDPDRELADARRPNNLLAAPLAIRDACLDDDRRTNEGPDSATALDVGADGVDGVICGYTEDWYRLDVLASGTLSVSLDFDAAAGDLDLSLVAPGGALLGASATESSPETVSIDVPAEVLVRVDGFLDAEASYRVTWVIE